MAVGRVRDFLTGQHACNLLLPRLGIQGNDLGPGIFVMAFFEDPKVMVALAGNLRKVGDTKHLPVTGQGPKLESDPFGDATPDPGINFVKDQGRHPLGVGRGQLKGQGQAGQLAPGGDFDEG